MVIKAKRLGAMTPLLEGVLSKVTRRESRQELKETGRPAVAGP